MSLTCNQKKYECTVVLPLFNEEVNIRECLVRFKNQLSADIQLMIVNDGSTDNTQKIVSEFISENNTTNFYFITKNNEGAARARLSGIESAKSDFIVFVDCDDAIDDETIKNAMSEFYSNLELDLVLFDYHSVDENNKIKRFNYTVNNWPISGLFAFENTIDHWGLHAFGIYKRNVLLKGYARATKLLSTTQNNINDDELIARCSMLESNLITLSKGKYYYSNNQESTTRRVNPNLYRIAYTAVTLKKMIIQDDELKHLIPAVNLYILRVLTNLSLKHFTWSGKLINTKVWKKEIAIVLKEVDFSSIYTYTKRKPKLLLWSALKYIILILRYGQR